MAGLYSDWGVWTWWIIAAVLLILELLLPGVFFMWLGLAAAGVGLVNLIVELPWQGEVALFAAFSVVFLMVGRPWLMRRQAGSSDQPNLNQRMYGYVGRDYVLDKPIANGRGKLTIEDTVWEIEGPDLPSGAWVRVVGVNGLKLKVVHKT